MAASALARPGFALPGAISSAERADRSDSVVPGFGLLRTCAGRSLLAVQWVQSQLSWPPVWSISGQAVWADGVSDGSNPSSTCGGARAGSTTGGVTGSPT